MEKMIKARVGLEEIRKTLVKLAKEEGFRTLATSAADRISEALQHFDHATMLVEQLGKKQIFKS